MKTKLLLLLVFLGFFSPRSFSQTCTSLGCAGNYGSQTFFTNISSILTVPSDCYGTPYKHVYWQFFYSPSGGDFTQTYTPTSTGDPLDLDYVIYDIGSSGPGSISCPVNTASFTPILCMNNGTYGIPTGPGLDATFTTVAGRFYAIAIYCYQFADLTYSFDIGIPQISGVNLTALNCPGVLPVKLSGFDAKVNDCSVNLSWKAETDSKFRNFEVEFSSDGSSFQSIATIPAMVAGISNSYSYTHSEPSKGKIFYRLKSNDLDGKIAYSKTIALNMDCGRGTVLIYPNPVKDVMNVNITNSKIDPVTASLFKNDGTLVFKGSMRSGTNDIDMSKMASGVYILTLTNNSEKTNRKIIKL